MSELATTKLSSKGQIVIPETIRHKLDLHTGDQFVVVAEKGVVILKIIEQPSLKSFESLAAKAEKAAKAAGVTKESVKKVIKEARKK